MKKIFIDPGHNYSKFDTGSQGNGLREQDISFQVSEKLSKLLINKNFEVEMSRNKITDNVGTSENTSLIKRVELANNFEADLFISLHCDSYKNASARGSHICVYSKNTVASNVADKINPHLLKLGLDGRNDLVVERKDVAVLKNTSMPAILIEMGFISNQRDADIQKNKQDELAKAIFYGICDYLNISYYTEEKPVQTPTINTVTNIKVKVDGKQIDVDIQNINNSVYVPIRKFSETLGYTVNWDDNTREIDIVTSIKNTSATQTIPPISPTKYSIIGTTHVIEIDPRNIQHLETQARTNQTPFKNFVNSVYFMLQKNGIVVPLGMVASDGKIKSSYATHNVPVATLICYDWNDVRLKYITDLNKEKNVKFAVSGYGIYPKITASEEGFTGAFSDVLRSTNRPIIGYRKSDNKIVIAVRANSSAERAKETAKNLGLDFAISLDAGGSTTLKVNGSYKFTGDGRKLWGGITWN